MKAIPFSLLFFLLIVGASNAANSPNPDQSDATWTNVKSKTSESMERKADKNHYYLAFGPVYAPDYEGSADYAAYPLVIARWDRGGAYVELDGATLSSNVNPRSLFQVGPVLRWHRGRSDVSNSRISRMRNVGGALEAGGLLGIMLRDPDAPRRRIGANVRVLQDVSGSHDGYEVRLSMEGGLPLGRKWSLDSRISSTYGSSDYMDTYFSVDADNAARSGLPRYDAGAGIKDAEINAMLTLHVSQHFGIGLIGRYRRYLGDARQSPVVSTAGSPNTFVSAVVATVRY